VKDCGEFPGQVVGVVHGGADTGRAGWREAVRGVADEERGARAVAVGLALGLDDPQAIDTEQRRSDVPGQVPAAFWVMVSLSKIHDLKRPRAS